MAYDWFTVVRNPYTRMLSEYHWCMDLFKTKDISVEQLNKFIQYSIYQMNDELNVCKIIDKAKRIYIRKNGNHFTPQYKYIDSESVIHIIKFENLKEEFDALMKQYNYNISMNVYLNVSTKRFTVSDFTQETIDLIQKIYKNDFEMFGYSIDPPI